MDVEAELSACVQHLTCIGNPVPPPLLLPAASYYPPSAPLPLSLSLPSNFPNLSSLTPSPFLPFPYHYTVIRGMT